MMRVAGRGDDGSAKALKVTNQGKLETNILGKRIVTHSHVTTLGSGETSIPFSDERSILLQYLEFATNHINGQIIIEARYGDNWAAIGSIRADASSANGFSALDIVNEGTGLWIIHSYQDGRYKFSTAKELYFPEGLRLTLRNGSVVNEARIACRLYGVVY